MRLAAALRVSLLLAAAACSKSSPAREALNSLRSQLDRPPPPDTIPEQLDYSADLQVNLTEMAKLPEGVLYEDVAPGEGPAAASGDSVAIRFDGWLPDGRHVDSATVSLRLGAGNIIPGIDLAIPGMKPGGRRKLVIPPGLAFGEEGRDSIPAFAVMVYDVELKAVVH
jgi:FKBP-type peptidyl-prolyl cis-trans isomerase